MELLLTKATQQHGRYFKKEVLDSGAAYVVSDKNSVVGMFSFTFEEKQAKMDFPYCVNKKAIELAFQEFLKDYPEIVEVKCVSRQRLDFLGFENQIYTK